MDNFGGRGRCQCLPLGTAFLFVNTLEKLHYLLPLNLLLKALAFMCQLHQELEYISQQFVPSSNSWLKKQKQNKNLNKKLVCKKMLRTQI